VFVGLAALAGVSAFFLFEPTGGGAPCRGPGKVATGVVRSSSGPPVGNEGHVHVYLDGDLLRLPVGLRGIISVSPGVHEIVAEFVATDHGPFQPRVIVSARFAVER
jgi:hypothetical protein